MQTTEPDTTSASEAVVTSLVLAGPTGEHEHDGGPGHPERPARLDAVMGGVRALHGACEVVTPSIEEASLEEIARVHDPAYLAALEAFCKEGGGAVDADTYARPDSWRAARRAAGAGLAALAELERRDDAVAFVPARPPGHHATADRAMGFCLLNSIAVAAASRTARGERVLIVDWDVHHGNGTQDIFWDEPRRALRLDTPTSAVSGYRAGRRSGRADGSRGRR